MRYLVTLLALLILAAVMTGVWFDQHSELGPTPVRLPVGPPAAVPDRDRLVIGGATAWGGVTAFDAANRPQGIGFQAAITVATALGLEPRFRPDSKWARCLRELEKGGIDCIAAAYYTDERAERFRYTRPYHSEDVRVWVLEGREFEFSAWTDLVGRLGARPLGGSYGEAFDGFADERLEFVFVNDDDQYRGLLDRGRVDYVILAEHDGYETFAAGNAEPGAVPIVPLERIVVSLGIHMLFSPRSPHVDRLPEIDRLLGELIVDGGLSR